MAEQEDLNKTEQHKKNSFLDYFRLNEVFGYFFRSKDPSRPSNINIRMMHGVNKISIIVFLLGVIYLIVKRFLWVDIEGYRNYCLKKKGVTEEFPFDESTLVFKVMGKIFALTGVESFASINLKVDPEIGAELREQYPSVKPGYHMNKKHWITVVIDGSIPDKLVLHWTDNSYQLVVSALTKSQKTALDAM